MDLKIMLTSFSLIFLAELGDKTQLATLAFASSNPSRLSVFMGASAALLLSTLLAVLLGEFLSGQLPLKALHIGAGVMFIAIGGWMVAKELSGL